MKSTRIIIEAVPPEEMRLAAYRTEGCGDWYCDRTTADIHIKVAGADVWDEEEKFLVAIHELVEARLAFKAGITEGAVDAFDNLFEAEREVGKHGPDDEPGDDPGAPYRVQHRQACLVEHLVALFLGKFDYGVVS